MGQDIIFVVMFLYSSLNSVFILGVHHGGKGHGLARGDVLKLLACGYKKSLVPAKPDLFCPKDNNSRALQLLEKSL